MIGQEIRNKILQGNTLEILRKLPDEFVDVCITSPPYYGLRDYGEETKTIWGGDENCEHIWREHIDPGRRGSIDADSSYERPSRKEAQKLRDIKTGFCSKCGAIKCQLGQEKTPDLYVEHLSTIFKEVYRVLKRTGLFFLNIGDSYCGGHKGGSTYGNLANKEVEEQIKGFQIHEGRLQAKVEGWEEKCLLMLPERIAFSCINIGFILRNKLFWLKDNPMPCSVVDRFNTVHEYIYMFAKTNDTQYWTNNKTGQLVSKQPKGIHGEEGEDWEWQGCPKCEGTGKIKENIEVLSEEGDEYIEQIEGEICKRCEGTGKIKHSFWKGHDYFFDIDALRMPHNEEALARYQRSYGSPTNKYMNLDKTVGDFAIDKRPKEFKSYKGKFNGFGEQAELFSSPRARNERLKYKGKEDEITFTSAAKLAKFRDEQRNKTAEESFRAGGMRQAPEPGEESAFNTKGRGPRDVFVLPTSPYSKAHFAVFPSSLIFQPILVGAPKDICSQCGKPKVRISKKISVPARPARITGTRKSGKENDPNKQLHTRDPERHIVTGIETAGYAQCNCGKEFKRGIVLDPFCGAGTTALVAKILGRDYIGLDIKSEYVKMSEERINSPAEIEKAVKNIKKNFPEIWEREIVKQQKLFL